MSKKKARSLQDILRDRQQEEFVGREEQLAFFRANLGYDVDDPRRRFIINVSGQGGVGKTWLVRGFQKMAKEVGAITAYVDEAEEDVPSVMGRIAERFEAQGHSLEAFAERYKVYRQKRQEIEADPEAPRGFSALLGRTLAKGSLRLARRVPVGGLIADFIDEEAVASLAGDFAAFVACKIKSKDEVRLVLEPVEILTPLFLADLGHVAEERCLALFFDTYERTGYFLEIWLRDLLEGRHGDVPTNLTMVIAGRDDLERNYWSAYEGLLARLPLEPFDEAEAYDYLARRGIETERVMDVILNLSGRLPLLMATLIAQSPDDPAEAGDTAGEAVERFLHWTEEPRQRQLAVDAALPRRLNQDVLAVLVGEQDSRALFDWLRRMPFVQMRGDCWCYHEVVRGQMLCHKRQISPQDWFRLHKRLAEYYESLCDGVDLDHKAGLEDPAWQGHALEALYHRLCQVPQQHTLAALNGFLAAARTESGFILDWAKSIEQAGHDADHDELSRWGARLVETAQAHDENNYAVAIENLTAILMHPGIEECWRAVALGRRGEAYWRTGMFELALADFNQALKLDSSLAWAFARRGATNRALGRFEESLADFDRALNLDPNLTWAFVSRGLTYREMRRYQEALDNFNKAICSTTFSFSLVWALAHRGMTYRFMKRYKEALADLNRSIEQDPGQSMAFVFRGILYRDIRRFEQALSDFQSALDHGAEKGWVYANRGVAYHLMGDCDQALSDLEQAVERRPDLPWALGSRGMVYGAMGQHQQALVDLDLAIQRDPSSAWVIARRGATYRLMGRYEEALADFDRAIAQDPISPWAIRGRGQTYHKMGEYEKALADFDRAIELEPHEHWYLYDRGLIHAAMNEAGKARSDHAAAIQYATSKCKQQPKDWRDVLRLSLYYLSYGEAEKAKRLCQEAVDGGANMYQIRAAVRDLDDFLNIFPDHPHASTMRQCLCKHLEESDQ